MIKKGIKDKLIESLLPPIDEIIINEFKKAYSAPYCIVPPDYEERIILSSHFKTFITSVEQKTGLSEVMIVAKMVELGIAKYD
jgi:hypothetical protein